MLTDEECARLLIDFAYSRVFCMALKTTPLLRCRHCDTCMFACGKCIACEDKLEFGGRGIRKQGCKRRKVCMKGRVWFLSDRD